MIRIKRIKPNPPLGPYPQLALWDQVGKTPTSINTNMTMIIVLISFLLFFLALSPLRMSARTRSLPCVRERYLDTIFCYGLAQTVRLRLRRYIMVVPVFSPLLIHVRSGGQSATEPHKQLA